MPEAIELPTARGSVGVNLSVGMSETVPDVSAGLIWSIWLRRN